MTDDIISQNIDISFWITLYWLLKDQLTYCTKCECFATMRMRYPAAFSLSCFPASAVSPNTSSIVTMKNGVWFYTKALLYHSYGKVHSYGGDLGVIQSLSQKSRALCYTGVPRYSILFVYGLQ
jgi:hypothetical protein